MTDRLSELPDEALGRALATQIPRYTAPARLRVAIVDTMTPRRRTPWLFAPVTACATALALVLFFLPLLPRGTAMDPTQQLVRAVVAEHTRAAMWGARRPDPIPAAPWLTEQSGIRLGKAFAGDESLTFVAAEPVYLEQRRGLAVHYRDDRGHLVTYVVLPAPRMPLPERQRVQIDRFKPALLRDEGMSVWLWKEGTFACFLVSDMAAPADLDHFKDYFVRVRTGIQPLPAY